jgi:putative photosynthetic complex assembly protein 2
MSLVLPPLYAAFVWWFSTGAVLLLVGRPRDGGRALGSAVVMGLLGLGALFASAPQPDAAGAYVAFTGVILLWGAQEIAFLGGWLTGPRPLPCPPGAGGWPRLRSALGAILWHELGLIACAIAVVAVTWRAPNQVALWTFATLWALRQSAKINLFLGVPVTNDALMPAQVRFLRSYFRAGSPSVFFPLSVTLATVVLLLIVLRLADDATGVADLAGLSLVGALFALGIVEHWFMLMPLPALTLWGWGLRRDEPPEETAMTPALLDPSVDQPARDAAAPPACEAAPVTTAPVIAAPVPPRPRPDARQRLEDLFRRQFIEDRGRHTSALGIDAAQPAAVKGRAS